MTAETGAWRRPWATSAGLVGFGMLAFYLALILSQEDNSLADILPWAGLMTTAATFALIAARIDNIQYARTLLIGSAVVYFGIGVVSLLTIGIGFILAAVLAVVGVAMLSRPA
jgi:hypothetical protein